MARESYFTKAHRTFRAIRLKSRHRFGRSHRRIRRRVGELRYRADLQITRFRRFIQTNAKWIPAGVAFGLFLTACLVSYRYLLLAVDYDGSASVVTSLFQQIASGLIGTAVVCISLITFFLQSNLTRLPYSLFNRFSSDLWVIIYFLVAFASSMVAGFLSIFFQPKHGAEFVLAFIALSGLVVTMLLLSFRRALLLVNPTYQLRRLLRDQQ